MLFLFVIIIRIQVFIVSHIRCGSALNKKRPRKKERGEECNVKIPKKRGERGVAIVNHETDLALGP